jgi:hypothetical protein
MPDAVKRSGLFPRESSEGTVKPRPASPGPMVFLFKRFRKTQKDDAAAPAVPPASEEQEPTTAPPAEPTPEPAPPPEPAPSPPPPPLPLATPPVTPVAPAAECFLCGTPLVDHHCPKCDMTWVE